MYSKGDIRYDREENSKVVVVQLRTDQCGEFVVKEGQYSEQTVYDFNSRYDYVSEEDVVVSAVYYSNLEAFIYSQRDETDLDELSSTERADWIESALEQEQVKVYHFPITRLTEVPEQGVEV
jgi:hypothetical protein